MCQKTTQQDDRPVLYRVQLAFVPMVCRSEFRKVRTVEVNQTSPKGRWTLLLHVQPFEKVQQDVRNQISISDQFMVANWMDNIPSGAIKMIINKEILLFIGIVHNLIENGV